MRKRWVQDREGNLIPADQYRPESTDGVFIAPDLPDFVSPIDGTIVRGRAGLREHCRLHDVVPTQELKGLPALPAVSEWKHTEAEKREIREQLSFEYDNVRRKRT